MSNIIGVQVTLLQISMGGVGGVCMHASTRSAYDAAGGCARICNTSYCDIANSQHFSGITCKATRSY
jgi:hypothetical protein